MENAKKNQLFADFRRNLPLTTLAFPEKVMEEAQKKCAQMHFPTTKNERWKYTRTTKIERLNLSSQKKEVQIPQIPNQSIPTIVFINGFFDSKNSSIDTLPENIQIMPLASLKNDHVWLGKIAQLDQNVFTTLNTLHATDGAFISVEKTNMESQTIQIIHVLSGQQVMANTRNLIFCQRSSQVEINQFFLTQDASQSLVNNVTEIVLEPNANLTFQKIQNEEAENFHLSSEYIQQQNDSTCTFNTLTLRGDFVRNDLHVDVVGINAETTLNGIYVPKEKQHVDNHISVVHQREKCLSNQLYKGVISHQATAVFNGRVVVKPNAQQINAYQSNANVLLSDMASVNSKPELEIFADDVKCSHGTTVGELDKDAIYYLRSRGISEQKAKELLVNAFISEIIDKIKNPYLKEYALSYLSFEER